MDDSAYVFFPYGEREISGENQLKKQLPVYYKKFLSPHKPALQVRAGSTERWWELTWHRTWQVEPKPKLVSTYFGDAGYFAWDQKGTCVVVQGFGWLPRKPLVRFPRRLALAYLAILNSELFSQLLSATSNNVAGGQWDLSPRFVGEIPIPLLRDYQLIEDLARQGEKIHSGELEEMPKKDYAELVRAAYLSA